MNKINKLMNNIAFDAISQSTRTNSTTEDDIL